MRRPVEKTPSEWFRTIAEALGEAAPGATVTKGFGSGALLPSGFHRIRHYGLLANGERQHHVETARALLNAPAPKAPVDAPDVHAAKHTGPTFVCRQCGAPMIIIETFTRAHTIRGPPSMPGAS